MKRLHNYVRVFLITCVIFLAAIFMVSRAGLGQSPAPAKSTDSVESRVKPTVLISTKPAETAANSVSVFDAAASNNSSLRNELTWTFGGKEQHGWYLYTALIGRLLKTDENPASKGFAAALSQWQEKSGLRPTGILDEDSLGPMIVQWQNLRLKNRDVASADRLITAPVSDFYDPTRLEELRKVERDAYVAYKALVAAAVADPSLHLAHDDSGGLATTEKYLKIVSSFRSPEYQEQLRRQSPNAGRAGLATNSPHFTGKALDLYVGGDPVDTKDANRAIQVQTPVYQWLVRNAERFGFRPYFYEPWHWEYVK